MFTAKEFLTREQYLEIERGKLRSRLAEAEARVRELEERLEYKGICEVCKEVSVKRADDALGRIQHLEQQLRTVISLSPAPPYRLGLCPPHATLYISHPEEEPVCWACEVNRQKERIAKLEAAFRTVAHAGQCNCELCAAIRAARGE